jgi:UDP-3-O-[3-hydroxymyristoyl] N-acetylglucosamine deacetylase/3-hydroxyacyl-[acyl-carrier-protein] dehydratase
MAVRTDLATVQDLFILKFKQKVLPGDTIVFELKLISPIRRGLVEMEGKAYVNGKVVCEAEMLAQVIKDKV